MPSHVFAPASPALQRRIDSLKDFDNTRAHSDLRGKIRGAVLAGNRAGLLAGTDGRGRPLAPLKAERKGRYRGATGKPLTPFGDRSRFITTFRADWKRAGDGRWALIRRWDGFDSRKGFPIALAHLLGVPTRNLAKRDVSQIRPKDWEVVKRLHADFLKSHPSK